MDRRRPLLVNIGEVAADAALREAAERNDVRVFPKTRVADVLDIDRSGLSAEEYRYALRAHFDFVVAQPEGRSYFAVEFDEPYHDTDAAAIARDRMKDSIADRLGLPVIRVSADFLRTVGRFTLLGWLIDLWFLQRAYDEAQERGEIPFDDEFMYTSFYEWGADGKSVGRPAYDLSFEAKMAIRHARKRGLTAAIFPELLLERDYSNDDYAKTYALLALTGGGFVIGQGRCRVLTRTSAPMPVAPFEVARSLAVVDVAAKLDEIERGNLLPSTAEHLAALRADTQGWIREGSLLSDLPSPYQ